MAECEHSWSNVKKGYYDFDATAFFYVACETCGYRVIADDIETVNESVLAIAREILMRQETAKAAERLADN
jgi:hypothetical protein